MAAATALAATATQTTATRTVPSGPRRGARPALTDGQQRRASEGPVDADGRVEHTERRGDVGSGTGADGVTRRRRTANRFAGRGRSWGLRVHENLDSAAEFLVRVRRAGRRRDRWVREERPTKAALTRLAAPERELYAELVTDALGRRCVWSRSGQTGSGRGGDSAG